MFGHGGVLEHAGSVFGSQMGGRSLGSGTGVGIHAGSVAGQVGSGSPLGSGPGSLGSPPLPGPGLLEPHQAIQKNQR